MGTDVTTAATFTNTANWQGVDDEPIAGSKNLVESRGTFKGLESIKSGEYEEFYDSAAGVFEYSFVKDKRYRILVINLSGSYCNFSTRETPDGSTVDGTFLITPTEKEVIFTASANANYLRHSDAVSCRVYSLDGSVLANTTDIETLSNTVKRNISDIEQLEEDVQEIVHGESSGEFVQYDSGSFEYSFVKDKYYKILRIAAGAGVNITVSTRTNPDDSTTMVDGPWNLGTNGSYIIFKASGNAGYLRHTGSVRLEVFSLGYSLDGLQEEIDGIKESKVDKETGKRLIDSGYADSQSSINNPEYSNVVVDSNNAIVEGITTKGKKVINLPVDIKGSVKDVVENPEWINVFLDNENKIIEGTKKDGTKYVDSLYVKEKIINKELNDKVDGAFSNSETALNAAQSAAAKVNVLSDAETAYFRFDTELLNVSLELDGINMTAVDSLGCETFQDQIYAKIDSLLTDYSDVLEKIDLAEFTDLTYPTYANLNGVASGNYLATPSYKTYMYKYHRSDGDASTGVTAERQKVLVVAGLHGWENASQLNTYIFLSKLCKNASIDYLNLASSCDFYIVPCINGYGAYHHDRVNANFIDINRNFPTSAWVRTNYTQVSELPANPSVNQKIKPTVNIPYNDSTLYSGAVYEWTGSTWSLYYSFGGDTAGSEFETKMIMGLINEIKPDIFIDHHSYGQNNDSVPGGHYNFYVEMSNNNEKKLMYQVLFDWTYRAWKDYPDYYPEKFETRPNSFSTSTTNYSTSKNWSFEKGVADSITLEVCLGIKNVPNSTYGEPIVRLNELMLRLTLEKLVAYQLKSNIKSNVN
jgi:hypothetical protein